MKFIDEVKITIESGSGGDGVARFRREKHVALGGPNGGDGGDGGSVYFIADTGVNTLMTYRGKKYYKAESGEPGGKTECNGSYGEDLYLKVPVGTIIRNPENLEVLCDLTEHDEKFMIAEGGRGGLGNKNFKTPTNQAPKKCTPGKEGIVLELELELKLIADLALVGLPNAGKSTLISVVSAAKPKVADYPFTTLEPNLGVVKMDEETSYVIADIPGLIEDAASGKGLGIKFLKHIERTKAFVHLVDVSWCLDEFEAFEQYVTIRGELEKYNKSMMDKKEIICLTKIDAMTEEEVQKIVKFFETNLDKRVLPISAVSGRNVDELKGLMFKIIQ